MKLFIVLVLTQISISLAAPEVELPNGVIIGREATTYTNKPYYAFEKVPYAKPPVGDLRFKAPVPPDNWDEPLDVSDMNVICYQVSSEDDMESEDCLYISITTPALPSEDNNVSLPVMVNIHGGGFVDGSGRKAFSDRIINNDVILASMNYRLGLFGFISTGDEVIPGNNGLKDQHLAIKWTHDNIHLFGGDPNKITILGESAGGASVSYQLLNQDNKGLIAGAILESGTSLSPWAYQRRAKDIAFDTAAILNDTFKNNRNSQDLLDYFLTIDADALDNAAHQYSDLESSPEDTEIMQGFYWAPVVEVKNPDAFLTRNMYGLVDAGNVVSVPILIGMTSEEGIGWHQDVDGFINLLNVYEENIGWIVPNDMLIEDETARADMGRKIKEIYTGGDPMVDHLGDCIRYFSDTSFSRSIIKFAELYSKINDTFFYQFSFSGQLNHVNIQYDGADNVGHGGELAYLFCSGDGCDHSEDSALDEITSERMVTIWTNFAKYQNPTPEASEILENLIWPLVSAEDGDVLYVNINETLEIKNHPKENAYAPWVELYDSLGDNDFDTY